MKLVTETDPSVYHSPTTTSPKFAPTSLECNHNALELKNGMKDDQIKLSCEEKIKMNRSSVEDFDDNADSFRAFVAPSSKKLLESYVDKSVMQCQQPKTIVCYKEIDVNHVKDICIDEGLPSLDNSLSKSTDEQRISKILPPGEDQNGISIKEKENSPEVSDSAVDDLKFSAENVSGREWTLSEDSKDSTQTEDTKLNISGARTNLEDANSVSKDLELCNVNSALNFAVESPNENDNNRTNASASNSEVESGSSAFNFDSLSPVANGGEEQHDENANLNSIASTASNADTEEPRQSSDSTVETRNSTNVEVEKSDTPLISTHPRHDLGESSFAVVDRSASLVNYSGPIPYSGSISLRSESSAASTRSFAFPILQSEWNSSPVKMAKAERRHYRKYKGWREGLLCCRF